MGMILDTSFVVAAEREAKRGQAGRADEFLSSHLEEGFFITFTVAGELACGDTASVYEDWHRLCRPFPILEWKREVSWCYGIAFRQLRARGSLIGANDLWIAATALAYEMPVVTTNTADFGRVEGLTVVEF